MTQPELSTGELINDVSKLLEDVEEKIRAKAKGHDLMDTAEILACQLAIAGKQVQIYERLGGYL